MGVRLGGWRRIMPFLFSLPPRRHELCGSAKYVAMPGSSRSSACRANSVPSSCVTPVRAAAGSRENMASCAATLAAAVSSGTIAAMRKRVRRSTSVCRLRPRADDAVGLPLAETAPVVLPAWAFADRRAQTGRGCGPHARRRPCACAGGRAAGTGPTAPAWPCRRISTGRRSPGGSASRGRRDAPWRGARISAAATGPGATAPRPTPAGGPPPGAAVYAQPPRGAWPCGARARPRGSGPSTDPS